MSRAVPAITSTNAGEWSRPLWARIDLARYPNAARQLLNMLPRPEGPCTRRPGTRHVRPLKTDGAAILIPFEFSTEQAYVIEAGAGYMRVHKDGGTVEWGRSYRSGSYYYGSYSGALMVPYEIATPYTAEELEGLRWAQSADVLYLVSPSRRPYTLSRRDHTDWDLEPFQFQDGPYLDENATDATVSASGTTGTVTLTASEDIFVASDVGRHIRLGNDANAWGWGVVTAYTSAAQVSLEVKSDLPGTATTDRWRLGAWSDTSGWPTAVTFFEDRLCWAATRTRPQTVWTSVTGEYDIYAPTEADGTVPEDAALTFTGADTRMNAIRWLSAGKALMIGTAGGAFALQSGSLDAALSATSAAMRRATTAGAGDVPPVRVGDAVLFAGRSRRRLLELGYDWEQDGYVAPERSMLARHLTASGIRAMAWQDDPWQVLWICTDAGGLVGMTYVPEQDVIGWHRHALGGADAKVIDLTVVPDSDERDRLWLIVERRIGGVPRRHLEILEAPFAPAGPADKDGAYFVDAGLTYQGDPVTTLEGLDHLEGELVQVLANGAAHPDRGVVNGAIALQEPASTVHVGLGSVARYVSMSLEAGAQDGTAIGKKKRVDKVYVWFLDTLGAEVGPDGGRMDALPFRLDGDPLDASPPLFSDVMEVTFPGGWEREACIAVEQRQPLPLEIAALAPRVTVVDG